jgi:hypothetical protein
MSRDDIMPEGPNRIVTLVVSQITEAVNCSAANVSGWVGARLARRFTQKSASYRHDHPNIGPSVLIVEWRPRQQI